MTDSNIEEDMNGKKAEDLTCSIIYYSLVMLTVACVADQQYEPLQMSELHHQKYSANTTFSKGAVRSSSVPAWYSRQVMEEYVARWEEMSRQLIPMNTAVDEAVLVSTFIDSVGYRYKSPIDTTVAALLTRKLIAWQMVWKYLLQEAIRNGSSLGNFCYERHSSMAAGSGQTATRDFVASRLGGDEAKNRDKAFATQPKRSKRIKAEMSPSQTVSAAGAVTELTATFQNILR